MRITSKIEPASLGLGPEARPVRDVRRRSNRQSWRGFSASHKIAAASMGFCESVLEKDQHTLLSADPSVARFAVQPHRLTYTTFDKRGWPVKRTYTPDAVVQQRDGRCVVLEVKASVFANAETWRARERAIRSAYKEDHGLDFVVMTEAQIRNQPRLDNCKIMLRHRTFAPDPLSHLIIREVIGETVSPATIGGLLSMAEMLGGHRSRCFSAIMQMALDGEATIDLSVPLGDGSTVSWS
ncbi:MAG: hypothetical protein EON58_05545 [Alphaproteobacteria bacterium]|nr:MAG: hypothetical protein EON58_05545 [Alphaproteobacteria bacterium]